MPAFSCNLEATPHLVPEVAVEMRLTTGSSEPTTAAAAVAAISKLARGQRTLPRAMEPREV